LTAGPIRSKLKKLTGNHTIVSYSALSFLVLSDCRALVSYRMWRRAVTVVAARACTTSTSLKSATLPVARVATTTAKPIPLAAAAAKARGTPFHLSEVQGEPMPEPMRRIDRGWSGAVAPEDTIFALSSAPGRAGVAVIRMWGLQPRELAPYARTPARLDTPATTLRSLLVTTLTPRTHHVNSGTRVVSRAADH